jgi:uncharacterized repeat protein (TIGR03803 family)
MPRNKNLGKLSIALLVIIAVVLLIAPGAWAQSRYKRLYEFTGGADGSGPFAGLVFDGAGSLYGTTCCGGANRDGTVFKLTRHVGGKWTEKVLHSFVFNHKDGISPAANLIFDQKGNLYGTTTDGGASRNGTVFELTPHTSGRWTEKVLYSFAGGSDGAIPQGGVVIDAGGNLYGNTLIGGRGAGVVFKLTPKANGRWSEEVIYEFAGGSDGIGPAGSLVFDAAGNLYGMTNGGGTARDGTVFELAPNQGGGWTESVLHSFTGEDGINPLAGVILDQAGNLYGTVAGGGAFGSGVAFILTKNQDGSWTENVIHSFQGGSDGASPYAGLTFDQAGNLYGTTRFGGGSGFGVVYKLTPNSKGGWDESVVHPFFDNPGAYPQADVIFDAAGNFYGTTSGDGSTTFGSVFEIMP